MDWNLLGLKLGIIAKARLRTASLARHKEEEARVVCVCFLFSFMDLQAFCKDELLVV